VSDKWRIVLLNQLSVLLPTLQQDPTPACALITALIAPEMFDFSKVMSIEPKVDFLTGLSTPSIPINLVTLDLLRKAASHSSDVDIVASMSEVVQALVRMWLCTREVAVHEKAQLLLERFLAGPEHNVLIWRRFLGDGDVYGSIFSLCSLGTLGQDGQPNRNDKTVAQGRLLALLPIIDNTRIRHSSCPEVEKHYGVDNLIDFAALAMVDYERDVLMHMTLIHFFTQWLLLSAERENINGISATSASNSSPALEYLLEKGLHSRTLGYFTDPAGLDSWDARHLRSSSAKYLEIYLSLFADHALDPGWELLMSILRYISGVLDKTEPANFVNSPPSSELAVLVRVPPIVHLLRDFTSPSLVSQIPIQPPSSVAFGVLATFFSGLHPHPSSKSAARALYYLYMEQHPKFWAFVIKSAETLALKDTAVAAARLVLSVINAEWEPMDKLPPSAPFPESMFLVRSEEDLTNVCGIQSLPPTGYLAILSSPALETVIPWLLLPGQKSTDLGIGGKGDAEGSANSVAEIKYDALQALYQRLERHSMATGSEPAWQDIVAQMRKRLAQGRWGGVSSVGSSVATAQR